MTACIKLGAHDVEELCMSDIAFKINGGKPLSGHIQAQRSKNAILPMIATALIPKEGQTVLHGVPDIADVRRALELATLVGAEVEHDRETHTVTIDASNVNTGTLPVDITERFRGSVLFLGPMITRLGYVRLPGIGGCDIGTRKIDFHHRGFARLGADVDYLEDGTTIINNPRERLVGSQLYLDLPSHTGTENLLIGASLATGTTIIENASVEPEVIDFCHYLAKMGANISGIGTRRLTIEGVEELQAVEYTPIPDRLVAGLLLMSAALVGGDITIRDAEPEHLRLVLAKLDQMGIGIDTTPDSIRVRRTPGDIINPINIMTEFYPGFPTDLQPCIAALSTVANGKSFIRERIFENRYDFVDGLIEMGADIIISQNNVCIVNGVKALKAANVRAASIRAGACLVLAGVGAEGETLIENGYQIDRGHEAIEVQLQQLGGRIERIVTETTLPEPALL